MSKLLTAIKRTFGDSCSEPPVHFHQGTSDDFPEVCYPIRRLEGIAHRANGQLYQGQRTRMVWTADRIVLRDGDGGFAAGDISCAGLAATGTITSTGSQIGLDFTGTGQTRIVGIGLSGFPGGCTGIFRIADAYHQLAVTAGGTFDFNSFHGIQLSNYTGVRARFGNAYDSTDSTIYGALGVTGKVTADSMEITNSGGLYLNNYDITAAGVVNCAQVVPANGWSGTLTLPEGTATVTNGIIVSVV